MPFWDSSAFWGIAGIIGGILISTCFFILGNKKQILKCEIVSTALITENMLNIPTISITLAGQPVQTVVSSTVKLTNIGNETISSDDFAKLAPLRISAENKFFSTGDRCEISSDNPNIALISHEINKNTVEIEFDFLRSKQSFSITLLHDGNLSVSGELKSGKMVDGESLINKNYFRIPLLVLFIAFIGLFFVFFNIFYRTESLSLKNIIFSSITGALVTFFSVLAIVFLPSFIAKLFSKLINRLKLKFKS